MTESSSARNIDRAYATLGVRAGAPRRDVVRQYRRLVRRWHPDRFVNDPKRHVEATRRMKDVNLAYELVMDKVTRDLVPAPRRPAATPAQASSPIQDVGRRLTPEEIDQISKAIGEPGIVTFLMRYLWWASAIAAAILLLGFGGRAGGRTPRPIEVIVAIAILTAAGVSLLRRLKTRRED